MLAFKNSIERSEPGGKPPKSINDVAPPHRPSSGSVKVVKLPPVDSQQLSFVLDEVIKKLKIISILPFVIDNSKKHSNAVGRELLEHLERHKVEIETFEELKSIKENIMSPAAKDLNKGFSNQSVITSHGGTIHGTNVTDLAKSRAQLEIINKNIELVTNEMKHSLGIILRSFIKDQLAYKTIMNNAKTIPISRDIEELIDLVEKIKVTFAQKIALGEDSKMNGKEHYSFTEHEDINNQMLRLENEVSTIEEEVQEMISLDNEKICTLMALVETIKAKHEECLTKIKTESEKQQLTYIKNQDSRTKKLIQEYEATSSKCESAIWLHFSEEAQLRKKKYKVEAEFEDATENFYKEMVTKQQEIDDIQKLYSKEKSLLELTEHKLMALKAEYNRIIDERQIIEKRQQAEQQQLEKLVRAVTTIQSMWRSYKVNKSIKLRRKKAMASHPERRKSVKKF